MTEREKLLAVLCALSLVAHCVREASRAFWQRRREDAREAREFRVWGALVQIGKALGIVLREGADPKHGQSVFRDAGLSSSDKWRIGEAFRKTAAAELDAPLDPNATRAEEPSSELLCSCAPDERAGKLYDPGCPQHGGRVKS